MAGRRIINLNGGTYNKEVRGNSVNIQGNTVEAGGNSGASCEENKAKEPRNITEETEVINMEGGTYTEVQNGVRVERWDA